jgi:hypothetical protein
MVKTEVILKVKFIIEKSHLGIHGELLFNGIPTAYLHSNLVTLFGDTVIENLGVKPRASARLYKINAIM